MKEVSVMIVKIKRYCSIVKKDHSTRYAAIVTYSAGAKISVFCCRYLARIEFR